MFRFGDPGGRMYTSVGTSNVNLLAHWTTANGASISVVAANGRTSGSCLRLNSGNGSLLCYVTKSLDSQPTWGTALALRVSVLPVNATAIISYLDQATSQCDLRLNADGSLSVTRNGTVLGTTASGYVSLNSYVHIEFKATIHPSAGTAAVWVNGVSRLSLSGLNTRTSTNSTASVIGVGLVVSPNIPGPYTYDFDDIIVYDAQTTDANGFTDITGPIGDCGLTWLLPTGAGTTTQFTADAGTNYARINEATPDGDTSYVADSTVGHIDTYALADLPGAVQTVKSIAAIHYARKDDVGSRGLKSELRSASANVAHASEIALGDNYLYYFSNWGQNPNNGSATNWTPTSVNALEAGQTVSS